MLCIHFGPGRLGLGLIVERLTQAHYSVCVVGPPGTVEEPREYGLSFADAERGLEYRTVDWYSDAATVDELPGQVVAMVSSAEPLLITCALGERITSRVEFLVDLVRKRPIGSETVLVACENEPHAGYRELSEMCAGLMICPCVVDRICAWPITISIDEHGDTVVTEHRRDSENRRVVVVHPVGEWVIAGPEPVPATLVQLQEAPLVNVIHGDIAGWRRLGRAPRSLAAIRAARVHAQAIELDGDPDDAIRRLLALHMRLRQNPELGDGEPTGTGLDSMRVLRCVLSSVKREGSFTSRNFAEFARQQGDSLIDKFVDGFPGDCASYLHRAALERRIRPSAGARQEAAELLQRSLPLRRDTTRDRRSRGMAEGDLLVLRGEHEAGAELLTRTVENFKPDMIRHYESARQMLMDRDLLRAA